MIEQIFKLLNEDGKVYSLKSEEVSLNDLKDQKIIKIESGECWNQLNIITEVDNKYYVYMITNQDNHWVIQKYNFDFSKLFDDNGNEL